MELTPLPVADTPLTPVAVLPYPCGSPPTPVAVLTRFGSWATHTYTRTREDLYTRTGNHMHTLHLQAQAHTYII